MPDVTDASYLCVMSESRMLNGDDDDDIRIMYVSIKGRLLNISAYAIITQNWCGWFE